MSAPRMISCLNWTSSSVTEGRLFYSSVPSRPVRVYASGRVACQPLRDMTARRHRIFSTKASVSAVTTFRSKRNPPVVLLQSCAHWLLPLLEPRAERLSWLRLHRFLTDGKGASPPPVCRFTRLEHQCAQARAEQGIPASNGPWRSVPPEKVPSHRRMWKRIHLIGDERWGRVPAPEGRFTLIKINVGKGSRGRWGGRATGWAQIWS
ncbi:hypothetical protein SKAU_G00080110 [Synaphobranchus kaupii]|uniref:Uncharacterized protein n=1 Tax=Synaphobranchus kaupii TaxID=118154 RepID=A0A9Q1J5I3_SYNKA|nr:hypothetical protein SKAU_G00080110 [Synaphobranchus kaupii]